MNRNLEKAVFDIEKVDALMYAIESSFVDIEVMPEEREKANRAVYAFYALWDSIKNVASDIDRLAGDERVVDAIYAVNKVSRHEDP